MVKFETAKEKFDFLVNGTKWWVISIVGVTDSWSCREYLVEDTTNVHEFVRIHLDPFWYAASWFNYVQPQLALTR